jgi:hypothetical protein
MGKPFPGITAAVLNTQTYEPIDEPGVIGLLGVPPGLAGDDAHLLEK